MCRTNLFTFLIAIFFIAGCSKQNNLVVYDLQCEGLSNPQGIDKTTPRFSWKTESTKNGTEQKAFQLLVASDLDLLEESRADFWDPGIVESASSVFVTYQGKKLEPGIHAFWKVRIWDEKGNVSGWSQPASFGVGLLSKANWQASYIGFSTDAGYSECPQFFKSFDWDGTNSKLFLQVNSLGYHEVYLNGKIVGNGVLTPAVSQFDKRSLINTYDVSSLVKKGRNDLILWLGSGW